MAITRCYGCGRPMESGFPCPNCKEHREVVTALNEASKANIVSNAYLSELSTTTNELLDVTYHLKEIEEAVLSESQKQTAILEARLELAKKVELEKRRETQLKDAAFNLNQRLDLIEQDSQHSNFEKYVILIVEWSSLARAGFITSAFTEINDKEYANAVLSKLLQACIRFRELLSLEDFDLIDEYIRKFQNQYCLWIESHSYAYIGEKDFEDKLTAVGRKIASSFSHRVFWSGRSVEKRVEYGTARAKFKHEFVEFCKPYWLASKNAKSELEKFIFNTKVKFPAIESIDFFDLYEEALFDTFENFEKLKSNPQSFPRLAKYYLQEEPNPKSLMPELKPFRPEYRLEDSHAWVLKDELRLALYSAGLWQ